MMDLVERFCPENEVKIEMPTEEDYDWAMETEPILDEAQDAEGAAEGTMTLESRSNDTSIDIPGGQCDLFASRNS